VSAPRCDRCGRFYRWREPGSSWVFVPDTPFTHEEDIDWCAKCTAKHGRPMSRQNVDSRKCSGVEA
jgi:rubredoxin